jgi:hypothetical protein
VGADLEVGEIHGDSHDLEVYHKITTDSSPTRISVSIIKLCNTNLKGC